MLVAGVAVVCAARRPSPAGELDDLVAALEAGEAAEARARHFDPRPRPPHDAVGAELEDALRAMSAAELVLPAGIPLTAIVIFAHHWLHESTEVGMAMVVAVVAAGVALGVYRSRRR